MLFVHLYLSLSLVRVEFLLGAVRDEQKRLNVESSSSTLYACLLINRSDLLPNKGICYINEIVLVYEATQKCRLWPEEMTKSQISHKNDVNPVIVVCQFLLHDIN